MFFTMFQNMDCAFRQQLLGTVEDKFVFVLHRPHQGYSRSIMMGLITHLYAMHGVIANVDLLADDKHFGEAYSPTNPIEVLWIHSNEVVVYTDSGLGPYSSNQVIDNTFQLVLNTDVFASDCQEWNKRAAGKKTLPHIKVFFATSQREWRLSIQN